MLFSPDIFVRKTYHAKVLDEHHTKRVKTRGFNSDNYDFSAKGVGDNPTRMEMPCMVACVALPTNIFFGSGLIDNWNHLYLSIFPVRHPVILR